MMLQPRRRRQRFRTQVGSRNGVRGGGGVRGPENPNRGPQDFLPFTPAFESGRRGLEDQFQRTRTGLLNQQQLIDPQIKLQMERMGTDRGYGIKSLNEAMADRGIFDSGIRPQLQTRDIDIPFGRQSQDLANWGAEQYGGLSGQLGEADLAYQQGLQELYLQLAAQQAQEQPLSLPQYGGRPRGPKPKRRKKKGNR